MQNKEKVLEDINSLIQDIDKCAENLVKARVKKDNAEILIAEGEADRLMIAARQELTFLYDYLEGKDKSSSL